MENYYDKWRKHERRERQQVRIVCHYYLTGITCHTSFIYVYIHIYIYIYIYMYIYIYKGCMTGNSG